MNSPTAQQLWKQAQVLLAQRRFDLAEGVLRKVLAVEPEHVMAAPWLALTLAALNRLDEAVDQAREAVRQRPENAMAHFVLSAVLGSLENFEAARDHAKEAIRLSPLTAEYRLALPGIYVELDEFSEALPLAEQGLKLKAESWPLQCVRAVALAGVGRAPEAKEAVAECLRKRPEALLSRLTAGWVCRLLKEFDQAEIHYRRALEIAPSNASSHASMGLLRMDQGRLDEARPFFEEALRINPRHRKARLGLEKIRSSQAAGSER